MLTDNPIFAVTNKPLTRLTVCLILLYSLLSINNQHAFSASTASVSGTLYQSDGVTPVTVLMAWVKVVQGTPCLEWVAAGGSAAVYGGDGAYTLSDIPPGNV